ncbi:hypothetical protein H2203_006142 [Taxawa tesnikishii (nom. ined.)]|nr:hypothetical protein H2203_006142 [Dothideales sp. JES 119]
MVALRQAVCLAASRDPAASSSLQLREISHILAPKEFARILRSELVSLLQSGCSRDRASRIRALALLSLYAEGDEGAEEASLCLAQAIHLAHTVGIHLGRAHADRQSKDLDNLFWSLWSLDKLNAAMHGRPQMMNERDVGLKLEDAYKSNEPAFCIWLKLSELLAKVVRLYSPTAGPEDTEWADSLVSFEEVVEEHQGWGVEPDLLTSLEIYYHALAVLSCRTRSVKDVILSGPSHLRRTVSVTQIVALASHATHGLVPLPMIPWAVSLCLSVSYQQFRTSKQAIKKELAKEQLERCVTLLEGMANVWWSARQSAKVGRKVLQEIGKMVRTQPNVRVEISRMTPSEISEQSQRIEAATHVSLNAENQPYDNNSVFDHMDSLFENFMDINLPADFTLPLLGEKEELNSASGRYER